MLWQHLKKDTKYSNLAKNILKVKLRCNFESFKAPKLSNLKIYRTLNLPILPKHFRSLKLSNLKIFRAIKSSNLMMETRSKLTSGHFLTVIVFLPGHLRTVRGFQGFHSQRPSGNVPFLISRHGAHG